MNAIIYARVSTPGQREEGTSLETQVEACLRYAAEHDLAVAPDHIFQEQASGADVSRPLLTQVRRLVRDGRAAALVVFHPDRLSRDATDLMVLSEEIAQQGAQLRFVNGPSGDSPEDKLLRFIFGYKSEVERRDIAERTMRGKRQTARAGKLPNGTGRGLYGYSIPWEIDEETGKPKAKREIEPGEAQVVLQVFDLFNGGYTVYEIAKRLNAQGVPTKGAKSWHPLGVKRLLTNPAYMGVTYYGRERVEKLKNEAKRRRTAVGEADWIEVPGFTPAIVSTETFERAQERLKRPAMRTGRATEPYLLTGHIFCGLCGTSLVGTTLNKKFRYYRCRGAWPTASKGKRCEARYIQRDKLNDAVWGVVRTILEDPSLVLAEMRQLGSSEPSAIAAEIGRLKREIRVCEDQEQRAVKLYVLGEVDDDWIRSYSGPLKAAREAHTAEVTRLESQIATTKELAGLEAKVAAFCQRVKQNLDAFDLEEKKMALKALDVRAIVTQDSVQVKGVLGVDMPPTDILTIGRTSA